MALTLNIQFYCIKKKVVFFAKSHIDKDFACKELVFGLQGMAGYSK